MTSPSCYPSAWRVLREASSITVEGNRSYGKRAKRWNEYFDFQPYHIFYRVNFVSLRVCCAHVSVPMLALLSALSSTIFDNAPRIRSCRTHEELMRQVQ